jgi:PEP-CTERM motif
MFESPKKKFAMAFGLLLCAPAFADTIQQFTPGDIVVSVEGCGVWGGTCTGIPNGSGTGSLNSSNTGYGDNQAAPLTLMQFGVNGTSSASYAGSLVLPQTASGSNLAVSGEYGSSSEGTLQLSGNGQYLTVMGYGISAATYNMSPGSYGPVNALAQSTSLTNQSTYTPVARVVALIDGNGNINSSTAVYNVFNENNPRSAFTANGTTVYISGQGASGGDQTGGIFLTTIGSNNFTASGVTPVVPTAITGANSGSDYQETRDVQIVNGQLWVSTDSTTGSTNRDYVGKVGTGTPTTTVGGPTQPTGFGTSSGQGKVNLTATNGGDGNPINGSTGSVNISPQSYFFASPSVMYVADDGDPKNNSANPGNTGTSIGDGGLQKWVNSRADGTGTWTLEYTITAGLQNFVENSGADPADTSGTTGLYGLTGEVIDGQVYLYATNYTISDLDPTYLYGITDTLSFSTASQASGESFTELEAAPADSNFKGVSFAPTTGYSGTSTPEPASFVLIGLGMAALTLIRRRRAGALS